MRARSLNTGLVPDQEPEGVACDVAKEAAWLRRAAAKPGCRRHPALDEDPATTVTVRRSPDWRKLSVPSRLAKIVSSLPIPVPGPGRKRVPRWRTMIMPAFTVWPSNSLTPRRCAFESRPFREEPRPFL